MTQTDHDTPPSAGHASLRTVQLAPPAPLVGHAEAMKLAEVEAVRLLGDCMLVSWYDRDRNFEAPQHVSECQRDSAVPGYVEYALSRKASLKIDVENGRFVFFYLSVEL